MVDPGEEARGALYRANCRARAEAQLARAKALAGSRSKWAELLANWDPIINRNFPVDGCDPYSDFYCDPADANCACAGLNMRGEREYGRL
jgi:hypothetical protein